MNRSQGNWPPSPLAMLKENEAFLKTRSDLVKNEEGDNKKLWESCVGTKRDCCKIVIIGIKINVNIYHIVSLVEEYFCWRQKILETWLFWSYCQGYSFVLFFFFKIFINIDGREGGRLACAVLILREAVKLSAVSRPVLVIRIVGVRVKLPQENRSITVLLQFRLRIYLERDNSRPDIVTIIPGVFIRW